MGRCACGELKKRLTKGMVLDIFLTKDNGESYKEGKGRLIRRIKEVGQPFPYNIHCKKHSTDTNVVNAIKEMWVIERADDRFLIGQEFVRNFNKFHSVGILSTSTRYESPEMNYLNEYCFAELQDDQNLCEDLREEIEKKRKRTKLYTKFINYIKNLQEND